MEQMKVKMVIIDKPKVDKTFPSYLLPHMYFKYRHVFDKIEISWGTKEFKTYLNSLLFVDRPGRIGFAPAVLSEILEIATTHDKLFPQFVSCDIWDQAQVFK